MKTSSGRSIKPNSWIQVFPMAHPHLHLLAITTALSVLPGCVSSSQESLATASVMSTNATTTSSIQSTRTDQPPTTLNGPRAQREPASSVDERPSSSFVHLSFKCVLSGGRSLQTLVWSFIGMPRVVRCRCERPSFNQLACSLRGRPMVSFGQDRQLPSVKV